MRTRDLKRALDTRYETTRKQNLGCRVFLTNPRSFSFFIHTTHIRLMSDSRKERLLKLQQQRIAKERKSQRNVCSTTRAWNVW